MAEPKMPDTPPSFPAAQSAARKPVVVNPPPAETSPAVDKIISGKVVVPRKTLGKKIAETFKGDDAKSVGQFIIIDVLLPALKNAISDSISQGTERLLFGDAARPRRNGQFAGRGPIVTPYASYGGASRPAATPRASASPQPPVDEFDIRNILLETHDEAAAVLQAMENYLEQYERISVSVLKGFLGITGSHTDLRWGWFDLGGSSVLPSRDGYLLKLPQQKPLDA